MTLSTVHKIKGKEWSRVIVFGANQGLFPHRLAVDEEEGERRVFHVALTRALERAVVVHDREAPSPFVAELDGSRRRVPLRPPRARGVPTEDRAPPGPARGSATVGRSGARRASRGRVEVAAAGLAPEPAPPQAAAIERALRAWRSARAKAEKVPAYVILNDADLLEVAARAPANLAELRRCHGVGPLRLERYGDELLAVIDGAGEAAGAGTGTRPPDPTAAGDGRR